MKLKEDIISNNVDLLRLNRENENLKSKITDNLEVIKQLERQYNPNYGTNTSGVALGSLVLNTHQDDFNSVNNLNEIVSGSLFVNPVSLNNERAKNKIILNDIKFKDKEILEITNKDIKENKEIKHTNKVKQNFKFIK